MDVLIFLKEPVSLGDDFMPKYHSTLFNSLRYTQASIVETGTNHDVVVNIKQSNTRSNTSNSNITKSVHNNASNRWSLKTSTGTTEYKSILFNELITSQFDGEEEEEQNVRISINNNQHMRYPAVKLSDVFTEDGILRLNTLKLTRMFDDPVCNLGMFIISRCNCKY